MLQSLEMSSITILKCLHKVYFSERFLGKMSAILPKCEDEKNQNGSFVKTGLFHFQDFV